MNLTLDIKAVEPVYVQIERNLRQKIQTGQIPPLTRLPSTSELSHQWRVTRKTVQKAMDGLVAAGLVERNRKSGTFVRNSTDKAIIAILTGPNLADESACIHRILLKIIREEIDQSRNTRWTCRAYDGLYGPAIQSSFPSPSYRHLIDDLQNYPIKGLIKLDGSFDESRGLGNRYHLPTVQLGSPVREAGADVFLNYRHFGEETVRFIHQTGLKKIAYLRAIDSQIDTSSDLDGMNEAVCPLGLPPIQIHQLAHIFTVTNQFEKNVYEYTLRLIETWQKKRQWPEALIVSDDIAMRGAALALLCQAPNEARRMRMITMANEGIEHPYGLPVARYEFSPKNIARELLRILQLRMEGKKIPGLPVYITGSVRNS
ncbi:MAG: winged helix-turn-helix domain-containing protein [Verrucomicrobiae bacterium]|nr:winged helix-turn-helix domain-containing protein [Verrucomicrobiae bacterium]